MRTTSLQVSGYRFLLRRLELALVIGDPRMPHDPLKNQRRAMIVGVLLSALMAGGAVMLSLLKPSYMTAFGKRFYPTSPRHALRKA